MSRQLDLMFPRHEVRAKLTLRDSEAPETCQRLWDALVEPIERRVLHAAWTGENVVFYDFPPIADPQELALESHKVRPQPGDVMFFYQPARRLAALASISDWLHANGDVYEISLSYGHSDLSGPVIDGWRGSHWATITDGLEDVARVCRNMRLEGAETIVLARAEA